MLATSAGGGWQEEQEEDGVTSSMGGVRLETRFHQMSSIQKRHHDRTAASLTEAVLLVRARYQPAKSS